MSDGNGPDPALAEEYASVLERINQLEQEGTDKAKAKADAIRDMISAQQDAAANEQILVDLMDEGRDKQRAQNDLRSTEIANIRAAAQAAGTYNAELEKTLQKQQQVLDGQNEQFDAQERITESTKGTVQGALGLSSWQDSYLGQVLATEGGWGAVADGIAEALNPADILYSIGQKIVQSTAMMVLEVDAAGASLAAATGQGHSMRGVMMDVQADTRQFGVNMAEAGAAVAALQNDMAAFSGLPAEAQAAVAGQAAALDRLGIATSTTANLNNQFVTGMGMTADQAMAVNSDLARTAIGLGIAPAEMAAGFEQAMPTLAKYGKDAPAVFKKLAATAKATGMEVQALISITEGMDTFEGAAQAAGQLNAVLGGDLLNSMDLLNASEDERIQMILDGVAASGKSWDSMDRFEQKALANAAGITDMAQAQKLFATGAGGVQEAQAAAEDAAVSEEELAAATAATATMMDKMHAIMGMLAVAVEPLVSGIHFLLDGILSMGPAGEVIIGIFAVLVGLVIALVVAMKVATMIQTAWGVATGILAFFKGTEATAHGVNAAATAADTAATSVAIPVMAAFAAVLYAAIPVVIAIAIAAIALAIAIAFVALAVIAIVVGFVVLIWLLMQTPGQAILAAVALGILGLVVAGLVMIFAALAPIAPVAAAAMAIVAVGLLALGVAMMVAAIAFTIFAAAISILAGSGLAVVTALIIPFALAIAIAGPLLMFGAFFLFFGSLYLLPAAVLFFIAAIFIFLGVTLAGEALMKLTVILVMLGGIAPMLPGIALGLFLLGPALISLGIGLVALGIASMIPGFGKGLRMLGRAVRMLTSAFKSVPPDVAQGMGQIFMALGNLTSLKKSARAIRSLAYAFWPFTAALLMFPVWKLLVFTFSIDKFQEAVALLGQALMQLPMDKMQQLMDMLAVMTETPMTQLAYGLWLVSTAIWSMSWALWAMPTKKMVSFELYADSWQKLAEAGVKVTPEVVDNTTKLVDQAQRYEEVQGDMRWPIFDPFLRALESSAKALQVKADGDTEIVMVLNDREFARAVEVAMEKKNSVLFG
jgi:hypothetical protein